MTSITTEDLSLAEISEILGVTVRGVRDLIKRAEGIMTDTEEKLGAVLRYRNEKEKLDAAKAWLISFLLLCRRVRKKNRRGVKRAAFTELRNDMSNLSEKLQNTFKRLRGKGKITPADLKEGMREVKLALLEADVNFKVVKDFVAKVTERASGADVMDSLTPGQQIVKIVNEELTALMGGENEKIVISSRPPTLIMMTGLQGAGKTTTSAKLGGMFKNKADVRFW